MAMDAIGCQCCQYQLKLSECPDSLLALLFMGRKLDQKLARNEWCCCPVLVNNPWRYSPSFTRANHWGSQFDVFRIEECSSADWNAESGVNTLNMSQHCLVMNANSKQ